MCLEYFDAASMDGRQFTCGVEMRRLRKNMRLGSEVRIYIKPPKRRGRVEVEKILNIRKLVGT